MRVLALHSDVIVFISRVWQTTCTAVRGGEEAFVIDSPVYPDELEVLPAVLEQAGYPVAGLLATQTVIPGHGAPLDRERALVVLEEDSSYLEALAAKGLDASLPPGRRTTRQREIHAENAGRAGG